MDAKYSIPVLLVMIIFSEKTSGNQLGYELSDRIKDYADRGIAVTKFLRYLRDQVQTSSRSINEDSVNQLAETVRAKLDGLVTVLHDLEDNVKTAFNSLSSSATGQNCNDVTGSGQSSVLLGDNFDLESWCLTGTALDNAEDIEFLPENNVIDNWKTKYQENKGIKYIKVGDKNGILYNYPAMQKVDTPYDARFSPWFMETASAGQRDVVIMVDDSRSMKRNDALKIAQLAVHTVLQTFNSNDRIAVLKFSPAESPTGTNGKECYASQLARATEINREYIDDFVKEMFADGGETSYVSAFQAAFQLFSNTPSDDEYIIEKRDKVILLFTDGDTPEDSFTVCNAIKQENEKFNNSVLIVTFGVGSGIQNEDLLTYIAKQQCVSGADIHQGEYIAVRSIPVENAMYSYNKLFSTAADRVVFSVPYKDIFSNGYLISVCSSVIFQAEIHGIFCLDVALEYLLSVVNYYRDDDGTYAFLLDDKLRVLAHPLLPNTEQIAAEYYFVHLSNVEIMDDIDTLQSLITRDIRGYFNTVTLRIIQQGSGGGQQVLTKQEPTSYYFQKIQISRTNYTAVIATSLSEKIRLEWSEPRPDVKYHLDHTVDYTYEGICKSFVRIAVKDRMNVAISPRCLEDPYNYLYFEVPSPMEISEFLRDQTNLLENPGLKNDIRDTVSVLSVLENLWNEADFFDSIVWRYIGTRNGVVIVYPGFEVPKLYDATIRGWYKGALAVDGNIYVTPPYIDAWGAGTVISLVRAVGSPATGTIGVIGMDLTIASLYYRITENVQECDDYRCIVINTKGFIVVHSEWIEEDSISIGERDIHIVEEEPSIAAVLVSAQIMQTKTCIDISESFKESVYWQIDTNLTYPLDLEDGKFTITVIPETNLFIIVKKEAFTSNVRCQCQASGTCPNNDCHCPCIRDTSAYGYCTGSLNVTYSPPCFPKLASIDSSNTLDREEQKLKETYFPECRDYRCDIRRDKKECSGVLSCAWCTIFEDTENYCSTTADCVHISETTDVTTPSESGGLKSWEVAIIVIVIVAMAVVLVVLIVVFIKKRTNFMRSDEGRNHIRNIHSVKSINNHYTTGLSDLPGSRLGKSNDAFELNSHGSFVSNASYSKIASYLDIRELNKDEELGRRNSDNNRFSKESDYLHFQAQRPSDAGLTMSCEGADYLHFQKQRESELKKPEEAIFEEKPQDKEKKVSDNIMIAAPDVDDDHELEFAE